jgi:hypothetical protein
MLPDTPFLRLIVPVSVTLAISGFVQPLAAEDSVAALEDKVHRLKQELEESERAQTHARVRQTEVEVLAGAGDQRLPRAGFSTTLT